MKNILSRMAVKTLRKNDGVAIVTVMIIFTALVIVVSSVMMLFSGNLRQAKYQENRTRAYYLALSGIDLGLSALLQEDAEENTLLEEFKWDKGTFPSIDNDLAHKMANISPLTDVIYFDNDTIALSISAINTSGKREVKLHSVATIHNSNVSYSITLIIDSENPSDKRWE